MIIKIDKNCQKALYLQIIDGVVQFIDDGVLKPGDHIPSTRDLSRKFGVTRSTVVQAYEELQARGYLESRPGSYNVIKERRKEVIYNPERKCIIDWNKASNSEIESVFGTIKNFMPERRNEKTDNNKIINFSPLIPDSRLYPLNTFRSCVNTVFSSCKSDVVQYGASQGFPPLRKNLARRMRLHGISVSEEEILITNGSQQAIDLVIRLLAGPGKKIIIESPTYSIILPLLRLNKAEILEVPINEDGMDLDILKRLVKNNDIAFVYTIPNFHNPTGITTSHSHREKLYEICSENGIPIVEDGFEEEMKYFGKVPLPIKSIDENNIVIYLGTFSKTLFPGIRIGWLAGDRDFIKRVCMLKRFSEISCGSLIQSAMSHFCEKGHYDLHIKRLHRIFRKRMMAALKTMDESLPDDVSWTRPLGGYTIWVKLPVKISEDELNSHLIKYDVIVSPGCYFFLSKSPSEYFRLSISQLDEMEITEGIKRLGDAIREICRKGCVKV